MSNYIDVIVPRGGKNLVEKVKKLSNVNVIGHLEGNCHVYVDKDAELKMAKRIVLNSKMRRTSICGAAETLLIDNRCIKSHALPIIRELILLGCEVVVDKKINSLFQNKFKLAKEIDWKTEYLSPKISIKTVKNVSEAVNQLEFNTSIIFVPPMFAADAIMEAVQSNIKTIVAITEGIPTSDMIKVKAYIKLEKNLE